MRETVAIEEVIALETNDLIESLVARHRAVDLAWIERNAVAIVLIGIAVSAALIWTTIGFRHDLIDAVESGRIVAKYVFILTTLIISGHLFVQMARPGRRLIDQALCYALPMAFILVAALVQVALFGEPDRSLMLGDSINWLACMVIVPILAGLPFIGLIAVLRRCAPTDLRGAGFAAGVFAAAIAATVYASHCPCDSPLFVAIWYPMTFLGCGLIGSRLTPVLARW